MRAFTNATVSSRSSYARWRRVFGAVVTSALVAGAVQPLTAASAQEANHVNLNILAVTDFHGHISKVEKKGVLREVGAALLACYVNDQRQKFPNTGFVSAGDNIGGSPFASSILKDRPTIEVLNAMGLEATAVGNHEFDQGWSDLVDRVGIDGTKLAKFPHLGANVKGVQIDPYMIVEKEGVKIAYVGAVTDTTASLVSPAGVAGITFTDPVAEVNSVAAELKNSGKADVVIALIHEGVEPKQFTKDVDAVVAGHTHVQRNEPGQPPVVQPGNYGNAIADIDIVFDKAAKKVVSVETSNHLPEDMKRECGDKPDPEVEKIVAAAEDAAKVEGEKVVTTLSHSFYRGANPDEGPGSNRGTESTLNSMIADATLESVNASTTLKADIGVMNAGGVRADLEKGDVTYAEAYTVQPFNNTLGVVDLTGAAFIQLLEQQWREASVSERPVLILGLSRNVEYSYDPEAPIGSRVTDVSVNGAPIELNKTYRIAASNFLLNEGDAYSAFGTRSGSNTIQDTGLVDIDAFNAYLLKNKDVAPRVDQTSVGVTFKGASRDALPAGKPVEIEVSSLSYTVSEEPQAKSVAVSFGRMEDGKIVWGEAVTADVDNAITEGNNETGRAKVSITVPEDAVVLRIVTDSGTDHQVRVNGYLGEFGPTGVASLIEQGSNLPAFGGTMGSAAHADASGFSASFKLTAYLGNLLEAFVSGLTSIGDFFRSLFRAIFGGSR